MSQAISTGTFCEAKWVVDPIAGQGSHTTIASALTSASSGETIFIRPGTYTENLTLKAGVNLTAYPCDAANPSVIIKGKATFSGAGTVSISNICLRTNGDYALVVSGNSASVLKVYNCYLDMLDASFLNYTSSSTSSYVQFSYCTGAIGTTGITIFVATGAGTAGFNGAGLVFEYVTIDNKLNSTTASTSTNCQIRMTYSDFQTPISVTGPGALFAKFSALRCQNLNATAFTTATSDTSSLQLCLIASGTASAISAGASTIVQLTNCDIQSSNAQAITGAGTVNYTNLSFGNSTNATMNTTTQTASTGGVGALKFFQATGTGGTSTSNTMNYYEEGTFTPTLVGASTAGTTTYTSQNGYYTRIGNVVYVAGTIVITAATGTGNALFGGLPFTVKNQTNGTFRGSVIINGAGWAWPVSSTMCVFVFTINATTATISCFGNGVGAAPLQMTNAAVTFTYSGFYQV